jgi:hypothetical protein
MPTTPCNAEHGNATRAGYVVRKTYFDSTPHEDVATFSRPDVYDKAVIVAQAVRASNPGGYAVIDGTFTCGCRIAG